MADDLTTLAVFDEETLVGELKCRFKQNTIYTYISDILISLNPYQYFPIYTLEEQEKYSKLTVRSQQPPHLFAISNAAFENLRRNNVNQVCVVSGESGAGKTESTKQLIKHLAFMSNRTDGKLHEQIVEVNPLLEAFGNAHTIINDNSSRFGKFVELSFSKNGEILGGKIFEYLLEKSRVVSRGAFEKNFHIFYYLFAGLDEECLKANLLNKPESHRILANAGNKPIFSTAEELNEYKKNWKSLLEIQKFIGFQDYEIDGINAILAAILHIGDISFTLDEQSDGVFIDNDNVIAIIGQLLSIKDMDLIDALILNTSTAGSEKVISLKNVIQANAGRDALAKALYGKLFTWIVHRANNLLRQKSDEQSCGWIGVLDIYGFENLASNSLEQICINLTNEQLQLFFNQHVFRFELDEYEREGINCERIQFTDNTALVQLILEHRNPPGLFAILDEECTFPQATDLSFVEKMARNFANKSNLISIIRPQLLEFTIKHFAVNITYNASGFLEKNRDILSEDLMNCLIKSQSMILQQLIAVTSELQNSDHETARLRKMFRNSRLLAPNSTLSSTIRSKDILKRASINIQAYNPTLDRSKNVPMAKASKTIATHFKHSLSNLVEKMFLAQPHFIRCIKSNKFKLGNSFDDVIVSQQLSYTGIMETVKIRRQGYSARFPFYELVSNYGIVAGIFSVNKSTLIEDSKKILEKLDNDFWRLGKTKVFLKHSHLEMLNKLQALAILQVLQCQTFWRAALARRFLEKLRIEERKRREEELRRIREEEERKQILLKELEQAKLEKEKQESEKAKLLATKLLSEESKVLAEFQPIFDEEADTISEVPLRKFKSFKEAQTGSVDTLKTSNSENQTKNLRKEISERSIFQSPIVWNTPINDDMDPTIFILNESLPRFNAMQEVIWGKLYLIEYQTIVAKSYIDNSSVIINGGNKLYDGEIFGLNYDDYPHINDQQTQLQLSNIKEGICISVDESKNIYAKKLGGCPAFIRGINEPDKYSFTEEAIIYKGEIRNSRIKVFDMKKFKSKIQKKLLSWKQDNLSVLDAYEMARWAVCGFVFEKPSILLSDTKYAINLNVINISALRIFGKCDEFQELFAGVKDPNQYETLLNIWNSLDIRKISPT